jgi:hypothetical protein
MESETIGMEANPTRSTLKRKIFRSKTIGGKSLGEKSWEAKLKEGNPSKIW